MFNHCTGSNSFFQVLNRFLFKVPVPWTEEMARYIFVWLSLLGSAKAVRVKGHIYVDILESLVKGKAGKSTRIVAQIISAFFFVILIITGFVWSIKNSGNKCETLPLDLFLIYMIVPLSGVLMLLFTIEHIYVDYKYITDRGEHSNGNWYTTSWYVYNFGTNRCANSY